MKKQYWWETFFETYFADIFLERSPKEVKQIIRFLEKHLHLKKNDRVFDQCCGTGTISHALARKGYQLVGVEQSKTYVRRAIETAKKHNMSCEFFVDDALRFTPKQHVDAAFNWYTSFGYFDDDTKNEEMLKRVFESLNPGGRFALDFHNTINLLCSRLLQKQYVKKIDGKTIRVLRTLNINVERGVLSSTWVYNIPGKPTKTLTGTVRLYLPSDLVRLFTHVGFRDIKLFGTYDGRSFSRKSPRCIIVARKPL